MKHRTGFVCVGDMPVKRAAADVLIMQLLENAMMRAFHARAVAEVSYLFSIYENEGITEVLNRFERTFKGVLRHHTETVALDDALDVCPACQAAIDSAALALNTLLDDPDLQRKAGEIYAYICQCETKASTTK